MPEAKNRSLREWISLRWYQYKVNTALYMLEPWERMLFNSILLSILIMSMYTAYLFMPTYIHSAAKWFSS